MFSFKFILKNKKYGFIDISDIELDYNDKDIFLYDFIYI